MGTFDSLLDRLRGALVVLSSHKSPDAFTNAVRECCGNGQALNFRRTDLWDPSAELLRDAAEVLRSLAVAMSRGQQTLDLTPNQKAMTERCCKLANDRVEDFLRDADREPRAIPCS